MRQPVVVWNLASAVIRKVSGECTCNANKMKWGSHRYPCLYHGNIAQELFAAPCPIGLSRFPPERISNPD